MENTENNKNEMTMPVVMSFNQKVIVPDSKNHRNRNYVKWGTDDNFPQIILDYLNYNSTSYHQDAIKKKVNLTLKNGWNFECANDLDKILANKIDAEIEKIVEEYYVFNAFAIQLIQNKAGTNFINSEQISIANIRKGYDHTTCEVADFYVISEDFCKRDFKGVEINDLNSNSDDDKKLYYFQGYNADTKAIYPIPEYSNAYKDLITVDSNKNATLNQAVKGYMQDFVLSFNDGVPDDEYKAKFAAEFKKKFEGSKLGTETIIFNWSTDGNNVPTFIPIPKSAEYKKFLEIRDSSIEEIVVAHSIPPALLIQVPGKLASSSERKELREEFYEDYIVPSKNKFERALNKMFMECGAGITFKFN